MVLIAERPQMTAEEFTITWGGGDRPDLYTDTTGTVWRRARKREQRGVIEVPTKWGAMRLKRCTRREIRARQLGR